MGGIKLVLNVPLCEGMLQDVLYSSALSVGCLSEREREREKRRERERGEREREAGKERLYNTSLP